jgi:chemotaxis regulatin CheY-phosphate phosphatase CheZ
MEPTTIGAQSWVAFPVAPLTPTTPDQQKWVAILAGIAVIESQGSGSEWIHEDVRLTLDGLLEAIFTFAQRTPSAGHHLRFVIEHTANVAAINSINSIVDSSGPQQHAFGFAVEAVETNFVGHTIRCFDGLTIKVAIACEQAQLLRVGFQSTLTGWIREFRTRDEPG